MRYQSAVRRFLTVSALLLAASAVYADKIDDFVKGEMARQHIPGLTLGVVKDGKMVKTAAYGQSDLELPNKTTIDDVFEIGSCTKQFTAFATLLLRDEGKLHLDDPVYKWIP
jgi:CubicO group peptidase (beta-lactamase class C family)